MKKNNLLALLISSAFSLSGTAADLTTNKIEVISATPVEGIGLSLDQIPANVKNIKSADMKNQSSLTVADYLNANTEGVSIVETQGNPYQPDVRFHGFNASSLLGAPQGLSVYQDGVRINEPFGDVVSWDLVPMSAIKQLQLIPGTNPVFGLNTLGGSISMQTKRGRDIQGGAIEASAGSWGRKSTNFEFGGVGSNGSDYYISGNFFNEDGWRDASPSTVRQLFGQAGWQNEKTDLSLTLSLADNNLTGNGLMPTDMMNSLGRQAIYTKPDETNNKMAFINLTGKHWLNDQTLLSGNAYYRNVKTSTLNGDLNNDVVEQGGLTEGAVNNNTSAQDLFAAACQAGTNSSKIYSGKGTSVPTGLGTGTIAITTDGSNTNEYANPDVDYSGKGTGKYLYDVGSLTSQYACSAVLNKSKTIKNGAGISSQITFAQPMIGHQNQLTLGFGYDYSNIHFSQSSQYGVLTSDRGVTTTPNYSDEKTGLSGETNTFSLFATNTLTLNEKINLTTAARYNNVNVDNFDNLIAAGSVNSLTAVHTFQRLNPAVGLTYEPTKNTITYVSYNEGTRAPTSMELGCANPNAPCKLPNSMAGDPDLKQVVTRSIDLGVRGKFSGDLHWSLGSYYAVNNNDIMFMYNGTSSSSKGYFANIGDTLRYGLDASLSGKYDRFSWSASYGYVHASFEDSFQANVVNNKDKSPVAKGDRIPGIPEHQLKLRGDYQFTPSWDVAANLIAFSSSYLQGNENNGYYASASSSSFTSNYYGNGKAGGYAVMNLDSRYKFGDSGWQIFAKVNNLFDRNYNTGGLQAGSVFNPNTNAYYGDDHRISLMAPGAPRAGWVGVRWEFGGAKKSSTND